MSLVFVSYSRINLDVVTQLVADLQAVGVDTWYDQTLTGGKTWWDEILNKIRECDIYIFALSPESWGSEACKEELKYVGQLGKPILPVLISDGINLSLLPPPLNEIQVTDYRQRDKAATLALFKAINTSPVAPPLPDPLPTPPKVPVSYLNHLKVRLDNPEPLSSQEQNLMFLELEDAIEEGRFRAEVRDLLLSMKKRDDLLAKVGMKIEAALKGMEQPSHGRPSGDLKVPKPRGVPDGNGMVPKRTLCPKCGAQFGPGARFCGACGNDLAGANGEGAQPPQPYFPSRAGWKGCRYICAQSDFPRVIVDVKGWLNSQGFDCQELNVENQGLLLQVKKRGGWRDLVGMSTALNILFRHSEETLTVETGDGKWVDKAAAGAVGMFVTMGVLAITAGYGAWEQAKMPEKIFQYIGTRLAFK